MSLSRPRISLPHQQPSWPLVIDRRNPLTRGLIAAWPFLPPGGKTLYDVGGNGLHGQAVNAPTWSSTPFGIGTLHDGSTGAGNAKAWKIPHAAVLDTTELTVAAIALSPGGVSGGTNQALFNYGSTTAGTWHLFLSTAGSYRYQLRVSGGISRIAIGSTASVGLHSYALTYLDPVLTGYLDGIEDATESTGGTLDTNQGDVYIGSHPDENGDKDWHDRILLLLVASRAWTAQEVGTWHSDPWRVFEHSDAYLQPAVAAAKNYYAGGLAVAKRISARGLGW